MSQVRQQVSDGAVFAGFNNTGSDIAANTVVCKSTVAADVDGIVLPTDHATPSIGVTLELIKNGARGDVQRGGGLAIGLTAATINDGDQLETTSTGAIQTLTGGGKQIGIANGTFTGVGVQAEFIPRFPSS